MTIPALAMRVLASARTGTGQIVASDASVATDRIGLAWLGDDGTWWLAGSPDGYPGPDGRDRGDYVDAAELRAIAAAVRHHPGRVLVLTDSLAAAGTVRAWQREARRLRPNLAQFPEIVELHAAVIARRGAPHPVSVRWAGKNIYQLNNGADRLTKLAARYGIAPDPKVDHWRRQAEGLAASAHALHEAQMRKAPPRRLEGTVAMT